MENLFIEAMNFRHACKEFDTSKIISDKDFNTILEMGRLSPSSFGFEPWKFLVVQNSNIREKLKNLVWGGQGQLPTASHFVIILSRKKNSMAYGTDYIQHMLKDIKQLPEDVVELYNKFYEKFQKEDFKLSQDERALFDWSTKQTYIALANMMTGAAYMGIDSCPIEGFEIDKMRPFLENEMGIDTQEFDLSCMLALGYRKDEPREKTRQSMDDIVQWYR